MNACYRCGGNHYGCIFHTPKLRVELYQLPMKQKGKKVETNLVYEDGEGEFDHGDTTHLKVAYFLPS